MAKKKKSRRVSRKVTSETVKEGLQRHIDVAISMMNQVERMEEICQTDDEGNLEIQGWASVQKAFEHLETGKLCFFKTIVKAKPDA